MSRRNGIVYQAIHPTNNLTQRRRRRLLRVLASHGWASVQEAADALDKNAYESILGVGPILVRIMREWLAESEA